MLLERLPELIGSLASLVAIVGAICGGVIYIRKAKRESIERLRMDLACSWTNEGDITSKEEMFVTLSLALEHGDLYGELSTSAYDRDLGASVDVGWGKAWLSVSELRGTSVLPVGRVKLRLKGNRNRLVWKLVGKRGVEWLPKDTVLWQHELPTWAKEALGEMVAAARERNRRHPGTAQVGSSERNDGPDI